MAFSSRVMAWLVAVVFFTSTASIALAKPTDFVMIMPGQPGSTEEAAPVMQAFAEYLTAKNDGNFTYAGTYFNDLVLAKSHLSKVNPGFGIVTLGYYMENARKLNLEPLAATLPHGYTYDAWWVLTKSKAIDKDADFKGTMLYTPKAAACLLPFPVPVHFHGSGRPMKAARDVSAGTLDGIVATKVQYEAGKALPAVKDLMPYLITPHLPNSPVVTFGAVSPAAESAARVMMAMQKDPEAQDLLKLLQTAGFAPADPALPAFRLNPDGSCPQ
ncbi:hypothetical protein [Desulfovibrio inopinatus]|uniref:hypothetical protein n=1 Tax=Desulfovibrio inopinatus TaxID=102109 RepID=UPI00041B3A8A|nr:hypothetical protein [Desulfovibrio inopinatus]